MVTITNGHDPSEAVVGSADPVGRDRYRIVWTGTLDRPDELQVFLEALAAVVLRRPELADRLQVEFFGDVADSCRAVARGFIDEGALGPIVSFRGFVPRHVALEAVAGADAALIMLGGEPGMGQYVPSKLFDYIGQDRQILGVLPPGDARDILEELGWGVVAEPDVADVERAIERLLASEPPAGRADPEGRYDRVALAARLATALDQASRAGRQASPLGIPA